MPAAVVLAAVLAVHPAYPHLVFDEPFRSLDLGEGGRWHNSLPFLPAVDPALFAIHHAGYLRATTPPGDRKGDAASLTTISRRQGGPRFAFQYGYVEARMRWPVAKDNWSAFWLLAEDRAYAPRDPKRAGSYCEIDIAEATRAPGYIGTAHAWKDGSSVTNEDNAMATPAGTRSSDWNVYGLLWTASELRWYFNGHEVGRYPTPEVCRRQQAFIVVGAQKWGGAANQWTDVDWIHVWQ